MIQNLKKESTLTDKSLNLINTGVTYQNTSAIFKVLITHMNMVTLPRNLLSEDENKKEISQKKKKNQRAILCFSFMEAFGPVGNFLCC